MTLTPQDKTRLRSMGIYVTLECRTTGECAVEHGGIAKHYPTEYLIRLARPTLVDRLRNWIGGVAA